MRKKRIEYFHETQNIMEYDDYPVVYLAHIEESSDGNILKFGISDNFIRRELKEHRNNFDKFDLIKIWKTPSNVEVEKKIKNALDAKRVLIKKKIGQKMNIELIELNDKFTIDQCISLIDEIVNTTKSKFQREFEDRITNLEREISDLRKTHEIEILKRDNRIMELETNVKSKHKKWFLF